MNLPFFWRKKIKPKRRRVRGPWSEETRRYHQKLKLLGDVLRRDDSAGRAIVWRELRAFLGESASGWY